MSRDTISQMLCGFCNAPWTTEMELELDGSSRGCDTCGYGEYVDLDITITCDNCKRVIYKKSGVRVE